MTEEERESLLIQLTELPEQKKDKVLMMLFYQMEQHQDLNHQYDPERFFNTVQKEVDLADERRMLLGNS